jgi:hypothetical protein
METAIASKPPELLRLLEEREQTVAAIREHKKKWTELHARFNKERKKVPKAIIEAAREAKAELHAKIMSLDAEVGFLGKQALDDRYDSLAAVHDKFARYFLLIARSEIDPKQLARIEKAATRMLATALRRGLEKA